jgi:DNA-binding protein H-NS
MEVPLSDEFKDLPDVEIVALIGRADHELKRRRLAAKEALKLEIEERLKATGLDLGDLFPEAGGKAGKRNGAGDRPPVKAKYRDRVSQEEWSGRGARPPRWVLSILSQRGWTLEEFKKSGEFDA